MLRKKRYGFGGAGILAMAILLATLADFGTAFARDKVVPASAAQIQFSFAPIVKKVAPAVVNVYARRTVRRRQRTMSLLDDPVFRHFFGDPDSGRPRTRLQRSLGSGVVVSTDGIIVTNHHVIRDAEDVRIAFADKREFDCDVILRDEKSDLAVLRIRDPGGEKFPAIAFGDSDDLEVGDIVLAIGNPFGVGQTVTQGIVSALARTRVGITDYQFFIQTDAAINPGNSGGALIDMKGRIVGINSAIYSRSGGSNGIGFAIPSNMARLVTDSARAGGVVRRPWLGATLQNVTADIAESLGLERPAGALVTGTIDGGPAKSAGLRVGDLILSVDGAAIEDPDAFGYRFATKGVGGSVRLGIVRNGSERTVEVPLMAAPESVPRDERTIGGYSPFTGIRVANLSPVVAEELDIRDISDGVVVTDVDPRSPAASVGIRAGDIIVEINRERIDSTRTLERVARSEPRAWRFTLNRNGRMIRMTFRG